MGGKTRIVCTNMQGLNSDDKKRKLLATLNLRQIDIVIVTDARLNSKEIESFKQNNEYNCIHTEKTNAANPSRGVILIWKKKSLI